MKLELDKQNTETLIELLTIAGYVITQANEQSISKAENMHGLIQTIFKDIQENEMPDSFDQDPDNKMIFPNAKIMSGSEDSPLYLLKSYNEYATADVLSQQLSLRDASSKSGEPNDMENVSPDFASDFINGQTKYLNEFNENGFSNLYLNKE